MAYFKENHSFERRANARGRRRKNIDPSSAFEFIFVAPDQTQTGAVAAGKCGTGAAPLPDAGLGTSLPGGQPDQRPSSGSPGLRVAKPHGCHLPSEERKGRKGKGSPELEGKTPRVQLGEHWGPRSISEGGSQQTKGC